MQQELGCINFDHFLFLKGKQLKQLINMKPFHCNDSCFLFLSEILNAMGLHRRAVKHTDKDKRRWTNWANQD